jgi:ribosomal protein S1
MTCKDTAVNPDKHKHDITFESLSDGDVVTGIVSKIEKYGVFIQINNSRLRGLCHISQVTVFHVLVV